MAYMAIQNGFSVLLDGWSNPNLRAFFLLEIIVIAVFCISGVLLPKRRLTIGIQLVLAILGLVFFVKTSDFLDTNLSEGYNKNDFIMEVTDNENRYRLLKRIF